MAGHKDDLLLEGLLYEPGKAAAPTETKKGVPLFDGNPNHYTEWKFRVLTRFATFDNLEDDEEKARRKKD